MAGQTVKEFVGFDGGKERERKRQLAMLSDVIEDLGADLSKRKDALGEEYDASEDEDLDYVESAFDAFMSMQQWLEESDERRLTRKQLEWVERECTKREIPTTLPITAADVPRGPEVPLAPVLMNLPKKPPGRK